MLRQVGEPSSQAAARSQMSRLRAGLSLHAKVPVQENLTRPLTILFVVLVSHAPDTCCAHHCLLVVKGCGTSVLTVPRPRAANNLFVFPAIALAAHLGQTKVITDHMLMAAAEACPSQGGCFAFIGHAACPGIRSICQVS